MKSPQKFTKESHVWKDSKWLYIIFVANRVGSSKQINATPSKTKGETATIRNDINALEYQIAHSEEMTRKISRINPRKWRFFANKGNHFKSICSPHLPVCSSDTLEVRGPHVTVNHPIFPLTGAFSLTQTPSSWVQSVGYSGGSGATSVLQASASLAQAADGEAEILQGEQLRNSPVAILFTTTAHLRFSEKKLSFAVLIVCILEAYGI
jgi:hypothetical protein